MVDKDKPTIRQIIAWSELKEDSQNTVIKNIGQLPTTQQRHKYLKIPSYSGGNPALEVEGDTVRENPYGQAIAWCF